MSGKKAKAIRRRIYGEQASNAASRQYQGKSFFSKQDYSGRMPWTHGLKALWRMIQPIAGETSVHADPLRQAYQQAKRDYKVKA